MSDNTEFPKVELDPELSPWIQSLPGLGWPALRHPLVYAVPYFPEENDRLNKYYAHKKAEMYKARDDGDFTKFVFIHERPYRLEAFDEIESELDDKPYWEILSQIWTDTENFWQNMKMWKNFWRSDRPWRDSVMDDDEKKSFADLPEMITIYRGFTHGEAVNGLSWTLSKEKAVWFAKRFSTEERSHKHPPRIASTTINKSLAFAYLESRGEQEIVIDAETFINVIKIEKVK